MINREDPRQLSIEEFKLPFAGELDRNNRWVKLAEAMPWEVLTEVYISNRTGPCDCVRAISKKASIALKAETE